jgi:hypothetical protein
LELSLARTTARCLSVLPGPGPFAPIPGEVHRDIGSHLEWLLQAYWAAAHLSPYRGFDGLSAASYDVRPPDGLAINGLMWCCEGREQWLDHFSANLRLTADHSELLDCTLRLGRRGEDPGARGGRGPFREWAYTFRSRPPAGPDSWCPLTDQW